mgnify:CR=1 FL=1
MGHYDTIRDTTPWLAYASWIWEILRRNPDYISYYASLKNKGLQTKIIGENTPLICAAQGFPTANTFGLLYPVDPKLDAGEGHAFWHPDVLAAAVRFHKVDESDIDRRDKPIQLSKFPAQQTHFLGADGSYHIRFLGRNFWFQMQCDGISDVGENVYVGLENNRVIGFDKRLKTQAEIYGIYDNSIDIDTPLHVPSRMASYQKSMIAYDIRQGGGSLSTIVSAFLEAGLIEKNTDEFKDYNHHAKNALKRAKAFIYGDYLKFLRRQ